jgi:hypothetical protein
MSELNQKNEAWFHRQLLATASALALLGYSAEAAARNDDEPQVWIELGGQLTRLDVGQESFLPEIMQDRPSIFHSSTKLEKLPHQSVDETGKVSFRPTGSGWVLSAGVRYGRSVRKADVTQQTHPEPYYHPYYISGGPVSIDGRHGPLAFRFASTQMKSDESHLVVDFQAGKDVGLGLFGGSSQINLGVRFAQFDNKSNITLNSDPDWQRFYKYADYSFLFPNFVNWKLWGGEAYHHHSGSLQAERSFHGIGPSLSWNGSSPFVGNREDGELLIDYGANLAVLFGRQRAKVTHQTSGNYHTRFMGYSSHGRHIQTALAATAHTRSRTLIVPNVGAVAGVSYRIHDFKISAGYRADFFFNAMDGGNDARKSEKIGNYGPFASVSIGLGG